MIPNPLSDDFLVIQHVIVSVFFISVIATNSSSCSQFKAMETQLSDYQMQIDSLVAEKSEMSLALEDLNMTIGRLRDELEAKNPIHKFSDSCECLKMDLDSPIGAVGKLQCRSQKFDDHTVIHMLTQHNVRVTLQHVVIPTHAVIATQKRTHTHTHTDMKIK